MNKLNSLTLLLLTGFLTFNSCKKDDEPTPDTTKPVISITSPKDHDTFKKGGTIHLHGTITDNSALASYKIDIHEADGHSHKSTLSEEWTFNKTVTISGTSHTIHEQIEIASDADSAEYHVIINALDAAGNAADFAEIEIEIGK